MQSIPSNSLILFGSYSVFMQIGFITRPSPVSVITPTSNSTGEVTSPSYINDTLILVGDPVDNFIAEPDIAPSESNMIIIAGPVAMDANEGICDSIGSIGTIE